MPASIRKFLLFSTYVLFSRRQRRDSRPAAERSTSFLGSYYHSVNPPPHVQLCAPDAPTFEPPQLQLASIHAQFASAAASDPRTPTLSPGRGGQAFFPSGGTATSLVAPTTLQGVPSLVAAQGEPLSYAYVLPHPAAGEKDTSALPEYENTRSQSLSICKKTAADAGSVAVRADSRGSEWDGVGGQGPSRSNSTNVKPVGVPIRPTSSADGRGGFGCEYQLDVSNGPQCHQRSATVYSRPTAGADPHTLNQL